MVGTTELNAKEVRMALNEGYNSRGRGRSPAEKKKSYKKYRDNKHKVLDLESRNDEYLILFPASDVDTNREHRFYNMIGTSAIIYAHEIGPRIGKKPVLRRDMDNGAEKSHTGVCSIMDLASLEEKLAGIKIFRLKKEARGYEDIIIFKLNRKYPKEEIKAMLKLEQERLDSLNKLIYAKVLHPDIHKQILELERIIPPKVKNMDREYRAVVGARMIDSMMKITTAYMQMTHGEVEELEGARILMLALDEILSEVSMFNELRIWEVSACIRVCDIVVGAKQLIKGKIINKNETTR